ncbi:MAG: recombination protein RecR [Alphaproteobacteria bacterium CG11_big_fil_rev_8_21_14_0_20_39_49]|nr:MAG: recombination protein RecR [Alphaproteobacteria bacterium CG11_big_fil_rev_8_21_14_0_20_39_49]
MQDNDIEKLIYLLGKLPGLGKRSARRAVLHLVQNKESLMIPLADAIASAADSIKICGECGNVDSSNPCHICTDPKRQNDNICVVEEVSDLWAIERSNMYRGTYHVLGGTLSAIDGRGPADLNIEKLIIKASNDDINEIILATNATVEGQTTAHYITERLKHLSIQITQIAHGIPMGGELEYLDDGTLATALKARRSF